MGAKENRFYVYEWYNNKTKEVFYVGKGTGERYKNTKDRNEYFVNYYNKNKNDCKVRKIISNIKEDEAFVKEKEVILKYKEIGQCKCNLTDGGEGCTFPEDTWNHWFRKLQYIHDIKCSMDDMINEKDYRIENLKTKTKEELQDMYVEYLEYRQGIATERELGLIEKIGYYEATLISREIFMLTDLFSKRICDKNCNFECFKYCSSEIDYVKNWVYLEDYLEYFTKDNVYIYELSTSIYKMCKFMKSIRYHMYIKIKSINFENGVIEIRFFTKDDKTYKRVELDMKDIILDILINKDKDLMYIINKNIFSARLL
jgi:hypothetical protein